MQVPVPSVCSVVSPGGISSLAGRRASYGEKPLGHILGPQQNSKGKLTDASLKTKALHVLKLFVLL